VLPGRRGEDQAERVGPRSLFGARLLDPFGEPVSERVPARRTPGVDRLAALPVLRRLDVQMAGDLDNLAVDRYDACVLVDLRHGHGGQLTSA